MTSFELAYRCAEPFMPALYGSVRRRLSMLTKRAAPHRLELLDVGGRQSHYTIGLAADVTISELPRESSVQFELGLGLTDVMVLRTHRRRSNIRTIVFDDMTRSDLPDNSYDVVVAVEVLEHVENDGAFVRQVARVLRPGGAFLMTTPNGDAVPNPHNRDHKRHYTKAQLRALLKSVFPEVTVEYAILASRARSYGLRSWSVRHPVRTLVTMGANIVSGVESARPGVSLRALETRNLLATAIKGD